MNNNKYGKHSETERFKLEMESYRMFVGIN